MLRCFHCAMLLDCSAFFGFVFCILLSMMLGQAQLGGHTCNALCNLCKVVLHFVSSQTALETVIKVHYVCDQPDQLARQVHLFIFLCCRCASLKTLRSCVFLMVLACPGGCDCVTDCHVMTFFLLTWRFDVLHASSCDLCCAYSGCYPQKVLFQHHQCWRAPPQCDLVNDIVNILLFNAYS